MGGFAFNYLRADLAEVTLGPFTQEEAKQRRENFIGFGATCSEIFPTEEDPPAKKGNYAEDKVAEFKDFFQKEMELIKAEGVDYYIVYQFMLTLIYHVKLFVAANDWSKSSDVDLMVQITSYPPNFYLEETAKIISGEASLYSPVDGSFWEDLAEELNLLAEQVRTGAIFDKEKAQKDLIQGFSGYSL